MNQFVMFAEQFAIEIRASRRVRADGKHGRKFSNANLPDVEIGYDGIAVAFHGTADLGRQIRRCRCAVEQDAAAISQECVSPGENNSAPNNSDCWIEPGPAEKFT